MDCKKALEWLPAHLDQELDLSDAMAMDEHLNVCAACHDEFIAQNALRTALKQDATYFRAPQHLEGRIRSALVTQDELPTVTYRKSQLTQLFQNLVGNSLKYCRPGEPHRGD